MAWRPADPRHDSATGLKRRAGPESTIYPHHQITTNDAAKYSTTAKVEGDPKKAINFSKTSQNPDFLFF